MCEGPALTRVRLDNVQGHQLNRQPLELYGLVRLMKVDHIGKAMERGAEQVKLTGGLNHRLSSYTQTSSLAEPPIGSLIGSLEQNDSLSSDVGGLSFQIQVL